MTGTYRFSPIGNETQFQEALGYVATQAANMVHEVLEHDLPIDTLTLFAHTPEEHVFLTDWIRRYGQISRFTHGKTLYVDVDSGLTMNGHPIKILGVRAPDSTRPEVGYVDFPVDDYDAIRDSNNPHIHEIASGLGQRLLEVRHPDFDILGYIIDRKDHDV